MSSPPRPSPARIARYELLRQLGAGGVASVFLARPADGGAPVALKVLHPHLRVERASVLEFIEEARLAVRISHPNVVRVLDLGEDPAGVFLAMEYVDGLTLAELLRHVVQNDLRVPAKLAMRVIDDVLRGLHGAHESRDERGAPLGVVHRDVTPQNILVGSNGVGRLTDFGIAKAANRTSYTADGFIKGKAGYMSPEQVQCKPVDRRCDVWAAGVIAWELLAARRLFTGNEFDVFLAIFSEDAPPLTSAWENAPDQVSEVIARALCRDPDRRIPTAEAFRQQLLDAWALAGGPLGTHAEVAEYVAHVRSARRPQSELNDLVITTPGRPAPVFHGPSRAWAVAAVVASFGVGAVALLALSDRPARAAGPPRAEGARIEPQPAARPGPARALDAPPTAPARALESDTLDIRANAAISQVQLGERLVAIAAPASAVSVQLREAERVPELAVVAIAADGRRAEGMASLGQPLELAFPDGPLPAPRRRAKKPLPGPAQVAPSLADNPYED